MDWVAFLDAHSIEYVTSGPNTPKGNISIKCPWCGDDDPSEHLSISLSKDAFGCWRSSTHAGRKPYSLVAVLLGCSFHQARLIEAQYSAADPETLADAIALLSPASETPKPAAGPVTLHPEFRPIKQTGTTARFWQYLARRGFDDVGRLTKLYGILCCQTGQYKDRVILPITQGKELVGWTARALQERPNNAPRYLSSSDAIKRSIFNEASLDRGQTLYIVEGPFDALKLDFYGRDFGHRATCLFGLSVTVDQFSILNRVAKRFKRTILLLDENTIEASFQISDWLNAANVIIGHLPPGVKDPGALTKRQVEKLIQQV